MADNKVQKTKNGGYVVKTSMLYQAYEFEWEVENFPQWPDIFKETSEEFEPAKDIIMYATLERFVGDSGELKCNLELISKGTTSFTMKFVHSIIGSDGQIFQDVIVSVKAFTNDERIKSYTILYNKIIEFSKSTKDQTVIFKWILEISALTTKNAHEQFPQSSSDLVPTIIEDFKYMFSDSLYTDLTLSVGNNHLRVHKSVLSARSPVFAKMLESPMDEKEKDVITISDIDLPILKTFIEFLYSGDMPEAEFESACALYYAADKYEVRRLQRECANVLLDKLDVGNSCQVLALANRHSDEELKGLVLHFMQSEFDTILGTDSWMDFVKVESNLAVEVMKLRAQIFEERSSS